MLTSVSECLTTVWNSMAPTGSSVNLLGGLETFRGGTQLEQVSNGGGLLAVSVSSLSCGLFCLCPLWGSSPFTCFFHRGVSLKVRGPRNYGFKYLNLWAKPTIPSLSLSFQVFDHDFLNMSKQGPHLFPPRRKKITIRWLTEAQIYSSPLLKGRSSEYLEGLQTVSGWCLNTSNASIERL